MELNHESNRKTKLSYGAFFSRHLRKSTSNVQENVNIEANSNEAAEILKSIREAYNEWMQANEIFEYAGDQESVDYCTYKIKACEIRYQYFLKKAKEKGIKLEGVPEVYLSGAHPDKDEYI